MAQDDFAVNGGVDLSLVLRPEDEDVLRQVDKVIDGAVLQGDLQPVLTLGKNLRRGLQMNGLALAKLLYTLHEHWDQFQAAGIEDEFVDVVYAELGVASGTTAKYISMWQSIFANPEIPAEVKTSLYGKPIRGLLLLTAAAKDGDLDWNQVTGATTVAEMRQVVRDTRGEQTSSINALTLEIDVRTGSLSARRGPEKVIIGMLLLDNRKDIPLIDAGIQRLIDAAGVMEK